jgi:hypothetical protein
MTPTPAQLWAHETFSALEHLSPDQRSAVYAMYFGAVGGPVIRRRSRMGTSTARHLAEGLQVLGARLTSRVDSAPLVDLGT